MQETYKNVCRQTLSFLEVKLQCLRRKLYDDKYAIRENYINVWFLAKLRSYGELGGELQVKNDHRSISNLSKEKAWKTQGLNEIRTHDLLVNGI